MQGISCRHAFVDFPRLTLARIGSGPISVTASLCSVPDATLTKLLRRHLFSRLETAISSIVNRFDQRNSVRHHVDVSTLRASEKTQRLFEESDITLLVCSGVSDAHMSPEPIETVPGVGKTFDAKWFDGRPFQMRVRTYGVSHLSEYRRQFPAGNLLHVQGGCCFMACVSSRGGIWQMLRPQVSRPASRIAKASVLSDPYRFFLRRVWVKALPLEIAFRSLIPSFGKIS